MKVAAEIRKRPVLDDRALYGLAGDFAKTICEQSESDPAALLAQYLVMFGNLSPEPYIRIEADHHPMRLFTVIVGATSKARKGTSLGHCKRLFELVDPTWFSTRTTNGGLGSGEGVIYAVRDSMSKEDAGVSDKRLMVLEGEFGSTLKVASRPGQILSPVIRQAWDSGNLDNLTKNSPMRTHNAHISLCTHITEEELKRTLDSIEQANGFANRFLWVYSDRSKKLPFGGSIDNEKFESLVIRTQNAAYKAKEAQEVQFDENARILWESVYEELSGEEPGLVGAILARSEAQVLRLALTFAMLDCSGVITFEHLDAAYQLWQYCEDSCRYIFGQKIGDPVADRIIVNLREKQSLSRTQISNLFNRHMGAEKIDCALEYLRLHGLISMTSIQTAGRPTELWSFCVQSERSEVRRSE